MTNKKWWESKTIWVNVLATAAIAVQTVTGTDFISAPTQVLILSVINLILRSVTKDNITW